MKFVREYFRLKSARTANGNLWAKLFDLVFVVSCPSCSERRAHIRRHFEAHGIKSFEFHDAYTPDSPVVKSLFKGGQVARFPPCFRCGQLSCDDSSCNNILTEAQVATFASYLSLWEKIAKLNCRVLITEDDVFFNRSWKRSLRFLDKQIASGKLEFAADKPLLLRLGWALNADHNRWNPNRLSKEVRMANPCHAITSAYAKQLLLNFSSINTTADIYIHMKVPKLDQAFTVIPPLAHELSWSTGRFASLIHPKKIRLTYLSENGRYTEMKQHKELLESHISHIYHRRFLVVGHPRCGTGYAAHLLRQCGLDIGHEADGRDGISSWMLAVDGNAPYANHEIARRRACLSAEFIIQVVRDLQTAVPSVIRDSLYAKPSYEYRRKHIYEHRGINLDSVATNFERAVLSIVLWSDIISEQQPNLIIKVEDPPDQVLRFVESVIGQPSAAQSSIDTKPVNADKLYDGALRPKTDINSNDWAHLASTSKEAVVAYCLKYSYPTPKGIL